MTKTKIEFETLDGKTTSVEFDATDVHVNLMSDPLIGNSGPYIIIQAVGSTDREDKKRVYLNPTTTARFTVEPGLADG